MIPYDPDAPYGYYRDKNGVLTAKGKPPRKKSNLRPRDNYGERVVRPRPKPKPQAAPSKPPAAGGKPVGPPVKSPLQNALDLLNSQYDRNKADITGYNSAFAELLAGMAPRIGGAYSGAAERIAGYGKDLSGGLRDLLSGAQGSMAAELNQTTGNYLNPSTYEKASASYNPNEAADIGYALGAVLPAKTLEEQGAAFQSAAEFAPRMAQQQGLYALSAAQAANMDAIKELQMEYASGQGMEGAEMPKASASLSKSLGYLVDVYGQPILNKKGKPIPVTGNDTLTAYQSAQLALSQQKEQRYITTAQNNLIFKSAAERRATAKLLRDGKKIDKTWSEQAGHIVLADGSVPKGPNGKPITYKVRSKATASPFQKGVKYALAQRGQRKVNPLTGEASGPSRTEVMIYLKEVLGLSAAEANRALKAARWPTPGAKGGTPKRPKILDQAPIQQLRKYAIYLGLNPKAKLDKEGLIRYIKNRERQEAQDED